MDQEFIDAQNDYALSLKSESGPTEAQIQRRRLAIKAAGLKALVLAGVVGPIREDDKDL